MEHIFHEKQEGSLCAQHCLNALLQDQYFSAVDLAEIAERLDVQEREYMAEGGVHTQEYQQFLQQPSSNFDDSGFFSVQVISNALKVWGLDMIPYNSPTDQATEARNNPTNQRAFICNFRQHWFAVRKLGNQWFNLNSLLSGPELISDTYLSLFLTQLQQEGYSIFIIKGRVPDCEADQLLKLIPAVQTVKPSLLVDPDDQSEDNRHDVQDALQQSQQAADQEDITLQRALQMSMEGYVIEPHPENEPSHGAPNPPEVQTPSVEEVRRKRLEFYNKQSNTKTEVQESSTTKASTSTVKSNTTSSKSTEEQTEEEMLRIAMEMSMQPLTEGGGTT